MYYKIQVYYTTLYIKCKEKVVFYLKKEGGLCIIYLEKI